MPTLGPVDPLPHLPRRVLVAGTSGSGKTTMVGRIATVLGVPRVELDSLYHGPGWTVRPTFKSDVYDFSAGPAWVTEWQYGEVRDRLVERADLLVWLDLPRRVVMRQVARRTLLRRLRHQVLWNGNVEPPLWTFCTDPEHVVRWAWKAHARGVTRLLAVVEERPALTVVRLRTRTDVARWLAGPLRASA
jgi:adenylate kinase family enzyme